MARPTVPGRGLMLLLAAVPAFLLVAACGSNSRHEVSKPATAAASLTPALTATAVATREATASAPATQIAVAAPVPASAPPSPPPSAPPAAAPPSSAPAAAPPSAALAAPTQAPVDIPTPPPPDARPCTSGQIKGDKATMTYYMPGMIGYNDLKANVACFNTMDAATSAGYHLPGQ